MLGVRASEKMQKVNWIKMKHLFYCSCLEVKALCKVKACLFGIHSSLLLFFLDRAFHNKSIYTLAEITHWAEITHFSRNHTFMFWHEESPLPCEEVNMDLLDKIKVEYYWLYQLMFLSSQRRCRNNCKKKFSKWVQKLKERVHMYGVWLSFSLPFFKGLA